MNWLWHPILTPIGVLLAIVGLALAAYSFQTGATRVTQMDILQETHRGTQVALDTKRLLENMLEIDDSYHADLLRRYSLGYILFAIDHTDVAVPFTSRVRTRYRMDWDRATVSLKPDAVTVVIAELLDPNHQISFRSVGVGAPRRLGHYQPAITQHGIAISLSILADYGNSVVCALGFSETSQPNGQ